MLMVKLTAATIAFAFWVGLMTFGGEAAAQTAERSPEPSALSAHAQATQRARTRIRVTPRCPYRTVSVNFPVPYECEYPGPGAVRQCASWLRPENRLSGTVIVPKMQCWWEPG